MLQCQAQSSIVKLLYVESLGFESHFLKIFSFRIFSYTIFLLILLSARSASSIKGPILKYIVQLMFYVQLIAKHCNASMVIYLS